MPGVAVIDSGNYDLQIATGFNTDALKLDNLTSGKMGGYNTTVNVTNLVTNPSFEVDTTNWFSFAGTNVRTTATSYSGTASLQTSASASGSRGMYTDIIVTPGQTYTASMYVKAQTGTFTHWNYMRWLNISGGVISNDAFISTATTNWQRFTQTKTAPAGAVTLRLMSISGAASATDWYTDAVQCQLGSTVTPYADGTYAEPYTGYTLTAQAWNSTPNLSSSLVVWGLNSSFIDSDYVLDGTTDFASVMDGCIGVKVKRGRRDVGDQFSAGTMSFTLNDTLAGGVFNPFDENSPYFDTAEAKPGLAPMRQVQLIRYDNSNVAHYLFKGYVVNYDYNFALGGIDTVTVYCADQFYLLAQTYLDEFDPSAELSGARIETVLDLPEVDFPLLDRDISTGTVELGHDAAYTVPAGTNVLQYISQINSTAEFGRLFMSAEGKLTFQNRIGNTLSASVADFHDDGTNIPFNGVGISFEADAVVNRTVVTGLNGNTAIASDAASIATYFIQTNSITNSLLHIQGDIDTAAAYLLDGEPEARYTSVETDFLMLTTAQRDTVASIEIGQTITVEKTFASGSGTSALAQELSVEGIEHTISVGSGHSIMLSTAPTTIVFELILDNPTYGTLDSLNVLG